MSDLEKLPKEILEHIYKTTVKDYEYYRDESIHVTELTYCLRKAYLRRKIEQPPEKTIDGLWFFYRGLIFDEMWTGLFPRNQVRVTHRIPNGPTIVGRIDFIAYEPDPVIYELKTISTLKAVNEPKEEHVIQTKFYSWCENVQKARIIYVSFEGVRIFDIDCSNVDEVVENLEWRAVTLYECLKKNKIPPKEDTWECNYCELKELCERNIY